MVPDHSLGESLGAKALGAWSQEMWEERCGRGSPERLDSLSGCKLESTIRWQALKQ